MPVTSRWQPQSGGLLIARLWVPQTMNVMLMTPAYVPDPDNDLRYADVAADEVPNGGGYVTGGKTITSRTTFYDALTDEYDMRGDDVQWGPGATITARYAFIYEQSTVDKYLWSFIDFETTRVITAGVLLLDWPASGILAVQAAAAV